MIAGAFLPWLKRRSPSPGQRLTGVQLNHRIFYSFYLSKYWRHASLPHSRFATSAGIVMIFLGVVAVAGLIPRRGWLTSVAGLLPVAGVVLAVIVSKSAHVVPRVSLHRDLGIGALVVLAGGVLAVVGGFLGARAPAPPFQQVPPPAPAA
jgi:hypothetical protein